MQVYGLKAWDQDDIDQAKQIVEKMAEHDQQ
jgi:hypothetical protein